MGEIPVSDIPSRMRLANCNGKNWGDEIPKPYTRTNTLAYTMGKNLGPKKHVNNAHTPISTYIHTYILANTHTHTQSLPLSQKNSGMQLIVFKQPDRLQGGVKNGPREIEESAWHDFGLLCPSRWCNVRGLNFEIGLLFVVSDCAGFLTAKTHCFIVSGIYKT